MQEPMRASFSILHINQHLLYYQTHTHTALSSKGNEKYKKLMHQRVTTVRGRTNELH